VETIQRQIKWVDDCEREGVMIWKESVVAYLKVLPVAQV